MVSPGRSVSTLRSREAILPGSGITRAVINRVDDRRVILRLVDDGVRKPAQDRPPICLQYDRIERGVLPNRLDFRFNRFIEASSESRLPRVVPVAGVTESSSASGRRRTRLAIAPTEPCASLLPGGGRLRILFVRGFSAAKPRLKPFRDRRDGFLAGETLAENLDDLELFLDAQGEKLVGEGAHGGETFTEQVNPFRVASPSAPTPASAATSPA